MIRYKKYGGTYHLSIQNSDDLVNIPKLDSALWVATSAPLSAFELDKDFLKYIDSNNDGRIICKEILSVINWLTAIFKNSNGINTASDKFKLEDVNSEHADFDKISLTVSKIQNRLNNSCDEISLSQVREIKNEVEKNPVSEAGVAIVDAAEDDKVKTFMQHIIEITGGVNHPTGNKGVNDETLKNFIKLLVNYIDWNDLYTIALQNNDSKLLPCGKDTQDIYNKFLKVKNKVDQYFIQSKALIFTKQVSDKVVFLSDTDFDKVNWHEVSELNTFLSNSPLAYPDKEQALNLNKPDIINPLYFNDLKIFLNESATILKEDNYTVLTEDKWLIIKSLFAGFENWLQTNPSKSMNDIDVLLLKEYKDSHYREGVEKIIALSNTTAFELDNLRLVEKLLLYQQNILNFVNNFVSFPLLYNINKRALFEKGSLVIDGRNLNFSVSAENRVQHKKIAANSKLFLLYVEVVSPNNTKYNVAVPVTTGTKGNLIIGKRGVFTDINGFESDAVVVDIVENPISFRETLFYPFKKLKSAVTGRFDSLTKDTDKSMTQGTTDLLQGKATAIPAKTSGLNISTVLMGGSVAIAALGSGFTYIVSTLSKVSVNKALIPFLSIILLFCVVALINTFFKLKNRDLSPIMEGSGWAINVKMKLTGKLARVCTQKPKWPKGSKRRWF